MQRYLITRHKALNPPMSETRSSPTLKSPLQEMRDRNMRTDRHGHIQHLCQLLIHIIIHHCSVQARLYHDLRRNIPRNFLSLTGASYAFSGKTGRALYCSEPSRVEPEFRGLGCLDIHFLSGISPSFVLSVAIDASEILLATGGEAGECRAGVRL